MVGDEVRKAIEVDGSNNEKKRLEEKLSQTVQTIVRSLTLTWNEMGN